MKIRLLILAAIYAMILVARPSFAQSNIPVKEKRAYSIEELLLLIEKDYALSYQDQLIPFQKKINLSARNYTVSELLSRICRGNKLKFQIEDRQIYLSPRNEKASYVRNTLSTLKGTITNASNGEVIIGASISISASKGVTTNGYGFYSISLPKGSYDIMISHTAYETQTIKVTMGRNQTLNLGLTEKIDKLPEVVVQGRQTRENITGVIPGVNTLNYRNKGDIPYFLGEVDVLQSSLLLPGINNLGEDSNGINIRGGSASQNLILLDEAVIFNSSHVYGLISVFNPESVNDVEIFKGSMPARYGGRTASVINIRQREGNDKAFNVAGGIGLVAGRLTVEGPIVKEKASFLVSARRSLLDLSNITSFDPERADFLDLNFKVNYRFNERNKLFLSGYFGNDRNENGLDQFRKWGNRTMTLRWNHVINSRLFMNTSAIFSEYTYRVTNEREAGSFQGTSRIINNDLKTDFSYYLAKNQLVNFGAGINVIKSNPGDRLPLPESGATNPVTLDTEVAVLPYIYGEQEGRFGKFQYNVGLRLTSFHNIGPEDVLIYEGEDRTIDTIIDTVAYRTGEISQSYYGIEPRAFLGYQFNNSTAIKLSYARNYQYLHLISNTLTPSPTDIWKISDTYIKPTISDQISLGLYKNLRDNEIEASAEVYYRGSNNVIEYRDNADLLLNENVETEILFGTGRAYGLELFVKKSSGNLTGWISYTLSRSETRVSNANEALSINNGEYFPNNFDQTHQFSTTGIYTLSRRLSVSANFIFATGKPTTLPSAKYELGGIVVPHFTERNRDRLPTYHRLDVSLKLNGRANKIKKNGKVRKNQDYWTLSIYNVYSRKNVFSFLFRQSEDNPDITEVVPFSVLDNIIPSITYNFRF